MKTVFKWTVDDYHDLINSGIVNEHHLELIEGEIIQMAPEGPLYAYLTEGIVIYLRNLLNAFACVKEAHPITLEESEPEPDIAIVKLPRQTYQTRHPYSQDIFWLIEISQSTLDYDLNEKKKIYAKAKIPEYWVIDVMSRQVYIFLDPVNETYQTQLLVQEGKITARAFPNITIAINKFWEQP